MRLLSGRPESGGRAPEHLAVPDAERLDPSLLAQGEGDEEPELNQFGDREVLVEALPQGIVSDVRVPDDGARVGQRGLLPGAELV